MKLFFFSIAVNVWTDSAQSLEMQRIYETTNPALSRFDGQAGAFKALAAMQTVIAVIRKAAAQNVSATGRQARYDQTQALSFSVN